MTDLVPGPFVPWLDGKLPRPVAGRGPLTGLRLAVKDLIDVAGLPTGAGNPAWLATHGPATQDAPVVAALLAAGASFAGKTHTDEMAYSLFGSNAHYGAPDNPAAPGHLTGGSSSGTAAAVAAGQADLGLGTDTGGSVRVPAGWCGLFGLRPSHGRVSRAGIVPLCASFDVPGLLTARLDVLVTAARLLLDGPHDPAPPRQWPELAPPRQRPELAPPRQRPELAPPRQRPELAPPRQRPELALPQRLNAPPDLWALAAPPVRAALAPALDALRGVLPVHSEPLFGPAPPDYRAGYVARTGWEFWRQHGDWVRAEQPGFGPGVGQRIQAAAAVTASVLAAGDAELTATRAALDRALAGGTVLVVPTAPQPAPRRGADTRPLRGPILGLTALASVAGLPGLTVPGALVTGRPVGLGLVGAAGTDESLLELARVLA